MPNKPKMFYCELPREEAERQLTAEEKKELEKIQKAFKFSITADAEKREITITLPDGENQLVLPEKWAQLLIDQIADQIRRWSSNQQFC